jgi:hypothetical protein
MAPSGARHALVVHPSPIRAAKSERPHIGRQCASYFAPQPFMAEKPGEEDEGVDGEKKERCPNRNCSEHFSHM